MIASQLASLLVSATISAFGLPLGLPPAAEDPVMARIAPADCAFYMSWAGTAAPQPGSANSFEQFLLDKEVVRSGAEIERVINKLIEMGISRSPEDNQQILRKLAGASKRLLRLPGAVFLQVGPYKQNELPDWKFALVVKMGDDMELVKQLLEEAARKEKNLKEIEIEGRKFYSAEARPNVPVVAGFIGNYVVYTAGQGVMEGILGRAKQEPPKWLLDAQRRLPVARRSSIAVIDIAQLMKIGPPSSGRRTHSIRPRRRRTSRRARRPRHRVPVRPSQRPRRCLCDAPG